MILALVLVLQAPTAGGVIDQGTFVIHTDTQEVGRETFRVLERHVGDSTGGWLLDATAKWAGPVRPAVFAPVVDIGRDSMTLALSFSVSGDQTPVRISAQPSHGHLTLRYISPGVERARELPADRSFVVIDDSVFTPWLLVAWRARPAPESLTVVFPRTARSARVAIQDLGAESTTLNRDETSLRHVLVSGGPAGPVHLWLGTGGRLMKVEIPDRKTTAERLPS